MINRKQVELLIVLALREGFVGENWFSLREILWWGRKSGKQGFKRKKFFLLLMIGKMNVVFLD
jgi:hypothetical protein